VRSRQWVGWRLDQMLGEGLSGKTFGVIGRGRIGTAVMRRAEAFGMRTISAGRDDDVDAVFATADVVSLHCPLTPATHHLVNARRLDLMKPTAILVNTARGGCVDETALIEALHAGRIFGAALDVFAHEPEIDGRLYDCPRLTLAPHIGSATTETRIQMARLCERAVIDVLAGRRPPNLVNSEVVLRG
jgi:glyoxylate reductase